MKTKRTFCAILAFIMLINCGLLMSCSKDADGSDQNGGVTTPAITTGKDNQRDPEGDNPGENNKPPVNSDEDEQVEEDTDESSSTLTWIIVATAVVLVGGVLVFGIKKRK